MQPPVWLTCRWCRSRFTVPFARRPDGPHPCKGYCSQSCGAYASAFRKTDREWAQQMRNAGLMSGRVRRGIALRRAIKALGQMPTRAELTAFYVGWECCRSTMQQRLQQRAQAEIHTQRNRKRECA